jgi:uncharacterized protein YuzE
MRTTYDSTIDAAYIYVVDPIGPGEASTSIRLRHKGELHAEFVLDFDSEGSLLGIEILSASRGLRRQTIDDAEQHN